MLKSMRCFSDHIEKHPNIMGLFFHYALSITEETMDRTNAGLLIKNTNRLRNVHGNSDMGQDRTLSENLVSLIYRVETPYQKVKRNCLSF